MKVRLPPDRHHRRWRHRMSHSLRWRLVALFLLLAFAMSAAFLGGMQKAFSVGWREAVRPLLVDYVDRLAAEIGSPPDLARVQALVARLPISVRIDGPTIRFDSHPKKQEERWQRGDYGDDYGDWGGGDRANARLLKRTTADGHAITFGVGDLDWHRSPSAVGWITLAVLLALTALAFAYVRRLLKPLDDIGAGARRFGAGDFTQPIAVRRRDELGDLAGQINTMGHDIHQMLEAKRAMLLAISHELRSPLTRARLNTELLPETADTQAPRDALLRDLAEMGRLITDLLESERLTNRHAALNCELTDLGALVKEVVDAGLGASIAAVPVAQSDAPGSVAMATTPETAPAAVALAVAPGLPQLQIDRVRLRLLLRNLLDNARRYSADSDSGAAAPIAVSLSRQGNDLMLRVRDHGPGVMEGQVPRLSEPFFRADAARQRSTGGVGLGLYLCRLVAQAHGGSLSVRNAHPGLEVTVSLPISAPVSLPLTAPIAAPVTPAESSAP